MGDSAQLIVDEKNRVTIPLELRRKLGIVSGSRLEAAQVGAEIVIRPAVPVKKPTESIWELVKNAGGRNPKKQARQAIAERKRLGK